ncbi:MAG: cupredoxin domain-containing protein [Thermodesulfovibrionales bacterium]
MKTLKFLVLPSIIICCFLFTGAYGEKNIFKASVDSDGVQRVKILAGSYFFDPGYVIVKVNIPVELTVVKEPEITPHVFAIKEPGAGLDIEESLSAEPKTIKFTPNKVGKYQFYCPKKLPFFKSHREQGMEGIIEVVE